jgi:glycosyltransferase involved in cell wall biosynthesis
MEPLFSVIVPTYNRPRQLATCLQALAQLEYPRDRFEVIVVDDGSPIVMDHVIAEGGRQINVRLLKRANAGPAAARNTGAAQAQGEFLAFTDDDCTPAANWLAALAQHCNAAPEAMVGGRVINPLTKNTFTAASQLIFDIAYRYYNADPQHARHLGAANLAMPAQRFRELGGFMPNLRTAEDRELCNRWRHHGLPMIYAPEAIIYHAPHLTFAGFCKQHFSYGRGAYSYHRICQQRGSGTMRQEMRFHANWRNWLLHPFTQVKGIQVFAWAGLLVVWQVANVAGFFWEHLNQKGLEMRRPPTDLRE